MSELRDEWMDLLGTQVVLDTKSSYLFIGTLAEVHVNSIVLTDVDVHDSLESSTSKELYVIQTLKTGIRTNRASVHVLLREVVSLSRLSDVIEY